MSHMINLNNPKAISERGEEIYDAKYRAEYELAHQGKFVAVNVIDGSSTLGNTASQALLSARGNSPSGMFHLIRVGHRGAFEVGLAYRNATSNRLHR